MKIQKKTLIIFFCFFVMVFCSFSSVHASNTYDLSDYMNYANEVNGMGSKRQYFVFYLKSDDNIYMILSKRNHLVYDAKEKRLRSYDQIDAYYGLYWKRFNKETNKFVECSEPSYNVADIVGLGCSESIYHTGTGGSFFNTTDVPLTVTLPLGEQPGTEEPTRNSFLVGILKDSKPIKVVQEIIDLFPLLLPAIISFIALRKGIEFLIGILRNS